MKHFLIIGLGAIGRRHTQNLNALFPEASFSFLRRSETSDALVDRLGGTTYTDINQALAVEYDLIVLATPSALHITYLPLLIAHGATLLVEKPIVTTMDDCETCLNALDKGPSAVRVAGFNFRHLKSLQQTRQFILDGKLGNIVCASFRAGQWLPDWRPSQDYRQTYSASEKLGGGVELDLVHEVDVARWFFGDLKLEFSIGRQASSLDIATNDNCKMIFSSAHKGPLIDVGLEYVSRQRVRRYEIVGDEASLIWDIGGTLTMITPNETRPISKIEGGFDISQTYLEMLERIFEAKTVGWPSTLQSLNDGIDSSMLAIEAREKGTSR